MTVILLRGAPRFRSQLLLFSLILWNLRRTGLFANAVLLAYHFSKLFVTVCLNLNQSSIQLDSDGFIPMLSSSFLQTLSTSTFPDCWHYLWFADQITPSNSPSPASLPPFSLQHLQFYALLLTFLSPSSFPPHISLGTPPQSVTSFIFWSYFSLSI